MWSGRLADAFFVPSYRQVSANLALVGPKFGLSCPQVGLKLAPSWPQVGPSKAKMAPSWPKLDQVGPKLAQVRPKLAPSCPKLGPSCTKLALSWPQVGAKLRTFRAISSCSAPRGQKVSPKMLNTCRIDTRISLFLKLRALRFQHRSSSLALQTNRAKP